MEADVTATIGNVATLPIKEKANSWQSCKNAECRVAKLVTKKELKGIEIHQKMQGDDSMEQLGIELQHLRRKAFPQACSREFDSLLKGRFFQSLHTKW